MRSARGKAESREKQRRGGATGRVVRDVSHESGVRADLTIPVDEIGDGGLEVTERLPARWLDLLLDDPADPPFRAAGEAELDLLLEREAETVHITGAGRFPLEHACVRCLREVRFDVELDLDLRLAPGGAQALPGGEEAFAAGDDMGLDGDALDVEAADLIAFDGRKVDLPGVLREQLFLEVPAHPSCESAGAQPPEGPCVVDADGALARERARWEDPRWAKLKALRRDLPE